MFLRRCAFAKKKEQREKCNHGGGDERNEVADNLCSPGKQVPADLLQPMQSRTSHIKMGKIYVMSCPAEQTLHRVHHVRVPTALFRAPLAQQLVQRVRLPA